MLDLPTFNAALVAAGGQPVTVNLLDLLTQTVHPDTLEGLIAEAQRGAALAKATLRHHGACLRIVHCLHKLDYPSTSLADASRLLGAQGENPLRAVLVGARQGKAGPLAQLAAWMLPMCRARRFRWPHRRPNCPSRGEPYRSPTRRTCGWRRRNRPPPRSRYPLRLPATARRSAFTTHARSRSTARRPA